MIYYYNVGAVILDQKISNTNSAKHSDRIAVTLVVTRGGGASTISIIIRFEIEFPMDQICLKCIIS